MKKILRDNKGSISALVVISVLLYSIVLTTVFMHASSKRKMQMESQILAKEAYEKQLDNLDEIRDEINGGKRVPEEATSETAPYFPDNTFTKKEGTIDTGLVIQDANENEYVWVVVPRTTAVYATTGLGKTTFTDADYTSIENDLKEYTKTYRGSTSYSDTWYADDKNEGWLSETEYKTLKNSMLKSVYENGGFYVGRYEAGIETTGTNRTSNTDKNSDGKYIMPSIAPVTKADAYPYTYVTRTQAQNLASNVNSGTKTSSLMFGVQWDLVLAFMHNKGNIADSTLTTNSTTIGNYINSTFDLNRGKYAQYGQLGNEWKNFDSALGSIVVSNETTGKMKKTEQSSDSNSILITTGGTEQSKVMNIYDIAGNVWEWTLEKTSITINPCAYRGGSYSYAGSNGPAAYRNYTSTDGSYDSVGFRVSLF
jgi:hypothetical protein